MSGTENTADREILIHRRLKAPRHLVFQAWTQAEHLARWWGPTGFTTTHLEVDIRSGGTWRYIMHGPDGVDYPNRMVFEEVRFPESISYVHGADIDDDPNTFRVEIRFGEQGAETELTMRSIFASAEARDFVVREFKAIEGGNQTVDRLEGELAELLAGPAGQYIVIERVIDAPRELVFKAWTDPQHLLRWYAPADSSIEFTQLEIRSGGRFHSCIRNPKYHDCWTTGQYLQVIAPELIRYSMGIADSEGRRINSLEAGMDPDWPSETTVTVWLEDLGTQTRLHLYQDVSESLARKTGAYPSWIEMLERLDAQLKTALPQTA